MADKTRIEWTRGADGTPGATWNPVTGCTKVSQGCRNCYIDRTPPLRMVRRKFTTADIGGTTGVKLHSERLSIPLTWRKPRMIFVCSLADLFQDEVPDRFIADVFAVMSLATQHTFQVLTKRHARMRSLLNSDKFWKLVNDARGVRGYEPLRGAGWPPALANVWVGVSTENQQWADIRIPALLDTPAAVRWISAEPLLGPITLNPQWLTTPGGLSWVVVGGESGPRARPMHPLWARGLRDQCAAANVAFHFKQWGEWGPAPWTVRVDEVEFEYDGTGTYLQACKKASEDRGATHAYAVWAHRYGWEGYEPTHKPWSLERTSLPPEQAPIRRWGKKAAGRELDGRTWDEYPTGPRGIPADLQAVASRG